MSGEEGEEEEDNERETRKEKKIDGSKKRRSNQEKKEGASSFLRGFFLDLNLLPSYSTAKTKSDKKAGWGFKVFQSATG